MRKNGKKICALFLALCALTGILPVGVLASETEAQSQIVGQKLYLGDDLTMHFYAKISAEDAAAGVMNVTVGENTDSYVIQEMTAAEDGTYDFSVALGAPQMTDDIKLTLLNGEETVLQKTYSVQDYAHYILEGKYTDETKALVKQMLNYGAAAQVYFEHNINDLANVGYEQTAEAVTAAAPEITVSGAISGISYYGSTMLFQSKIAVRHYFVAPNGTEGLNFTVNNQPYTAELKGDMYYIEVTGINPQQMSEEMAVAVSNGTDTLSFQYSPMCYITRMYNKETTGQALKDLLAAANSYFAAAEKYDGLTDGDVSLKANSSHVYPLNETPYIHLQAQTTLSVSEVREGVYPRVGLRLTNEAGATVDFVLGYANNQVFWADGFYVVTTDAQGNEATPEWVDLPEGTLPGDDGVVLSVHKEFETITLYIGEYQALQRKLAGFGADSAVTVSLYSRYTDTQFTDYSMQEITMPDSNLNAGNHNYVINEVPYENMKAHTELTVSEVMNEVYARVGLRLTNENGQTLDYVLAYNKDMTFWANGFYVVTLDAEGKESTQWIDTAEGILTEDTNVALDIKVLRGTLHFYMNGALVHSGTFDNFAVDGGITAALYSKHTTTDFSNYSVTELDPADSETDNSGHVYPISETASANFAAQTNLTVSEVREGVYPRVGLRLTSEAGQTLDYVLAYKNTQALWNDYLLIVTWDAEGKEVQEWIELSEGTLTSDDNVTLKVRKALGTLQFYLNGTLVHTKAYDGFAAENAVTANLYSKYTATDFTQHSAVNMAAEDSIVEAGTHAVAIGDSAYESFTAQTEVTVSEVLNGVYARVGLRLTNEAGENLDYVLAYNNNGSFWADGFYIVTWDAEGKDSAKWVSLESGTLPDDDNVTLKVEKIGGTLNFYLDGILVKSGAYEGFGAVNKATASLYSRHTATDFSNYSAEVLHPEDSNMETGTHLYAISSTTSADFVAQTELSVSEVLDGVYARVGLRLTNENGQTLDYVMAYNKNTAFWANGFYIVTWDADGNEKTKWVDVEEGILPDDDEVTLKVQLQDGVIYFYIGETEVFSGTFDNFAADVASSVALYSKHTTTDFSNYSVN